MTVPATTATHPANCSHRAPFRSRHPFRQTRRVGTMTARRWATIFASCQSRCPTAHQTISDTDHINHGFFYHHIHCPLFTIRNNLVTIFDIHLGLRWNMACGPFIIIFYLVCMHYYWTCRMAHEVPASSGPVGRKRISVNEVD